MARRLILDTGVLVGAERGRSMDRLHPEDDVAVAAVTVAEFYAGIELAAIGRREARSAFLAAWLDAVTVVDYDLAVAAVHGRLLAHTTSSGRPRGAHDLIIAASAAATRRTLVTTDSRARFGDLPGLDCLVV